MHDHKTWYGIFHNCVQFIYVIYQQTPVTVQYKINLKCMFKDILYTTLRSLQNQTLVKSLMMYKLHDFFLMFILRLQDYFWIYKT